MQFVYRLDQSLYINLTNRCTAQCVFCPLSHAGEALEVRGYDLTLTREPEAQEVLDAIVEYEKTGFKAKEVVFCGFGEPTLRLAVLKEIAAELKAQKRRVRLNTNGHGNVSHKRNIVPELAGLIDEVRVSLNTGEPKEYHQILQSKLKGDLFGEVKKFILECKKVIPKVIVTAVRIPELDVKKLEKLVFQELGVSLMLRALDQLGHPNKEKPHS